MVSAVIVGAGKSIRMGFDKLFAKIDGEYVIKKSVLLFLSNPKVDEVILVINQEKIELVNKIFENYDIKIVEGGERRQDSVINGVMEANGDIIAIHDAARPFASQKLIDKLIDYAQNNGSCAPGIIPKSTIKEVDVDSVVKNTPNRNNLREIQTPQIFRKSEYLNALLKCHDEVTDDCKIMENAGYNVKILDGEINNIKLTTKEDFMPYFQNRIGYGYDVHKLVECRKLIIGGIEIPYEKGLLGHSDADVLTHAIMDSLLGASNLGDIGKHFPDNDRKYLGANSIELLSKVKELIQDKGYKIINIDATIIAQEPKMSSYISAMKQKISNVLNIDIDKVSIKATTEEGLGFTGQKLGIAASAICLLTSEIN